MKNVNLPKLAIVGRPNVGKSSLFNRIVGARKAIVEPSSGTTRDRIYADIKWKGKGFTLIDMAGFEEAARGDMSELVLKQLRKGIGEADIVLFVTDGLDGITPLDRELSLMLRKTSKKIYLVVNKIDTERDAGNVLDFFELGLGEPYAISAMHGRGIDMLCNDLVKNMERSAEPGDLHGIRVAIVGRPNVGKSSYLNALLSEERVIVHPTAGTTRDAIDTDFKYKDRDYILIDTAGIRHNPKINRAADFYGGVRSEEAIKRSDVVMMLLDGYEGLMKDDMRIIDICLTEGKGVVIAVNKWDLVKDTEMAKYNDRLIEEMSVIRDIPVIFISAKTGRNVNPSLDMILSVYEKSKMVVSSAKLTETLKSLNNAPSINGKNIKFKYLVQEGIQPPKFILGLNNSSSLNDNTKRFIENFVKKEYDFKGVPIIIRYR